MIQAFQEMKRVREIAALGVKHGLGDKINLAKLRELAGIQEQQAQMSPEAAKRSGPERFRCFLTELGTTFIKFGQILSTRVDLLPQEYLQELAKLQDDVTPVPFEDIRRQIEESFGKPLEQLFKSFDQEPLATASIAQVHTAVTLGGEEVVVKVQKPGIAQRIQSDMLLLKRLAKTAEAVFEESAVYSPVDLVDAFEASISEELDCTLERDNLAQFHETHRNRRDVVVPRPHMSLCSPLVVTMDRIQGKKLRNCGDLPEDVRQKLTAAVVEETYRQMFVDGLFHADPHPGNLLMMEDGRLGIIDLGAVGRMSSQMKENLLFLLMGLALKDADTVTRTICRIAGDTNGRTDMVAFRGEVQSALDKHLKPGASLDSFNGAEILPELTGLAVANHIRIPREYALLCRSAMILEGVVQKLCPGMNVAETMLPYAKRSIMERYEGADAGAMGLKTLLRMQTLATDLPMQFSQILMDLEKGRFQVTLASAELEHINASLKGLGVIIFLGFLACGLTIGLFLSLAKMDAAVMGMPVQAMFSFVAIGLLFGIVLVWSLYSGKDFKVRLGSILGSLKRGKGVQAGGAGKPSTSGGQPSLEGAAAATILRTPVPSPVHSRTPSSAATAPRSAPLHGSATSVASENGPREGNDGASDGGRP